jgi:hypothetical protein
VFALTLAVAACSPTPAAVPAPATPPPSTSATPSEEPSPPASEPAPSEAESEPIIGIAACDRYLAAYQKCEPKLSPEIQAGDRRTYEAEKNWLVFMKTSPEGKGLEAACQSMIAELTKSCE